MQGQKSAAALVRVTPVARCTQTSRLKDASPCPEPAIQEFPKIRGRNIDPKKGLLDYCEDTLEKDPEFETAN